MCTHMHISAIAFLLFILNVLIVFRQFVFIAVFAYFMSHCVSYTVLFHNIEYNTTHKVTLDEAVLPMDQCLDG